MTQYREPYMPSFEDDHDFLSIFIPHIPCTGFLIDFISGPVNAGFTSAVAILIVVSQVKDIFGIRAVGSTLLDMIISLFKDIGNFRVGDMILGSVCIVVILLLRVSVNKSISCTFYVRNYLRIILYCPMR